ncbi:unnamed protein product [Didymodactylos carnosus]|uniref:Nucleolar protein 10 n=1 Tax=Didymodactylos carnosus TaxID=1234261 RepID=A0A8S2CVK9_9BILA|nr:unnamed protein product [Didymodactylos carnosus]CAF3598414.1 unnamed protein product [Didymodactylos carnosus]
MQVTNVNDVRVYNLSSGKSLPEWLTDYKRRKLKKKDSDLQQRIELIQGFEMPQLSNNIALTRDGQYIFVTGLYKPRVRCYDVNELSLKFERCFDNECIKMKILSDDYSKVVFMHTNRYIEFHAQSGNYYTTRIPKTGRDFDYCYSSCDLYVVGASNEIFRFNLEQGQFLQPLQTSSNGFNACQFNTDHELFVCGSIEGHVECYDPRARTSAGMLDCALYIDNDTNQIPGVSCVKFKDGLNLGVGMTTGQILMFDIRAQKPYFIKDHNYGFPIKQIDFHTQNEDYCISIDKKICKIWNRHNGKNMTSIEPGYPLNDFCNIPGSGLLCITNDAPKVSVYYIPSLGNAPKWCAFLDNITEELEEKPTDTVYDDYKFLTRKELETLGLSHLIGSDLLRAYMHGFFMDIRLYNQAKTVAEPFAFNEYRKKKLREKLDLKREKSRVPIPILPKVNKDLAEKLLIEDRSSAGKKKKTTVSSVLKDSRFQTMFSNPDYQIDVDSEHFKLVAPLMARLDKQRRIDDDNEMKSNNIEQEQDDDMLENDLNDESDLNTTDDEEDFTEDEDNDVSLAEETEENLSSLIPIDNPDDVKNIKHVQQEQQMLKTLPLSQRTKSSLHSEHNTNKIKVKTKDVQEQNERKNVRRAPGGRGKRGSGRGRGAFRRYKT